MRLIPDIYVRVYVNKFIIRRIGHEPEMEVSAYKPFTTTRLLVGDFDAANTLLRGAIKKNIRFSFLAPRILIQPMEMIEEGLSPVELHIFKDQGTLTIKEHRLR